MSHVLPFKSLEVLLPFPSNRENTLRDSSASTRRKVSGFIEVVSDLAVAPFLKCQYKYRTDKEFFNSHPAVECRA